MQKSPEFLTNSLSSLSLSLNREMIDHLTALSDETLCNTSTAELLVNYENVVCA